MTESTNGETTRDIRRRDGIHDGGLPDESETVAGVGTYEADDAVVFYDSENPLAWVQSRVTVPLEEVV